MALIEIPTENDLPSFDEQVILDGTLYTISFYFNPRINDGAGSWFVSLADANRTLICGPVPLVVATGLFDRFVELGIPPGTVFAFDTSGLDLDPGQFDLGDRVRVYYLEVNS